MPKTRLRPRPWRPPVDRGLAGMFTPNRALADLQRWEIDGAGPEDVAITSDGTVFTGLSDGRILRLAPPDGRVSVVAHTAGRPLGIEIDQDGTLIVCDAHRGLLRVFPDSGSITTLVDTVAGRRLLFTNNSAIASDGSIYFSDTSTRFPLEQFKGDLLEHSGTGRLLRWSPSGDTEVLLDGLDFANGVALSNDESAVYVAETGGYRVRRLRLTGPNAGASDVLIDNLPGFPDNMSTGSNGVLWIAIASQRSALLDRLLPAPAILRKLVWALPDRLQPEATRIVFVVGVDEGGEVVHNLQAPGDRYHYVTGVREHDGWLYLGSLVDSAIARVPLEGVATA